MSVFLGGGTKDAGFSLRFQGCAHICAGATPQAHRRLQGGWGSVSRGVEGRRMGCGVYRSVGKAAL